MADFYRPTVPLFPVDVSAPQTGINCAACRSSRLHDPTMTACTYNINLKTILQQETESSRSSSSYLPSKVVEKPRRENDAWCVVASDGSTSIIACQSASNAFRSNGHNQAIDQGRTNPLENRSENLPAAPKIGVDLSYLNVEKESASKLIAGMHAMPASQPATSSRIKIAMPSAKTDLQEIFKTDNVCMVSPPRTTNKGFRVQ